jgi:DNA polymerase type B, organellar and viral
LKPRPIIGVDGEGHDTPDGRHVYTYLCAADEAGRVVTDAENPNGLTTDECVRCLSRIPKRSLCFGFMFTYDVTKIIEGLTPEQRYWLVHPDLRTRRHGKRMWRRKVSGFDYFAGHFSYASYDGEKERWRRQFYVWDCFKFFGVSFVKALETWNVGTREQRERIARMKLQRGHFDRVDAAEVRAYCQEECTLLARMMRKLIDTHRAAGIELKRYDGPGSTAAVLLRKNRVMSYAPKKYPKRIEELARHAYTGGRFENSRIGEVREPCHGFDLNSAYPSAMVGLPCLKHGGWTRTKSIARIHEASMALCKVIVPQRMKPWHNAWEALPCRTEAGSIVFGSNFSGWFHKNEALESLQWGTEILDAWVYETDCDHAPFNWVPSVYAERLRLKDERGLPFKSGLNSGYGKLAQHVGHEPEFQNWLWAGAITSETRAAILRAISPTDWSTLAIATDGILCTKDKGIGSPGKPLGAWDHKGITSGLALVKPGVYWPLDTKEEGMRARGIGRRDLYKYRKKIERAMRRGAEKVTVKSRRFFGAKRSVYASSFCGDCEKMRPGIGYCLDCLERPSETSYRLLDGKDGAPVYGRWLEQDIEISFDIAPKRDLRMADGRLRTVDLGGIESEPYTGKTTPEGLIFRMAKDEQLEQPDWEE